MLQPHCRIVFQRCRAFSLAQFIGPNPQVFEPNCRTGLEGLRICASHPGVLGAPGRSGTMPSRKGQRPPARDSDLFQGTVLFLRDSALLRGEVNIRFKAPISI